MFINKLPKAPINITVFNGISVLIGFILIVLAVMRHTKLFTKLFWSFMLIDILCLIPYPVYCIKHYGEK
jgi:hypothetical protein